MAMITCSAGHEPIAYNQTTLVGRTTCPLCIAKGADGSDECARQLREAERLMGSGLGVAINPEAEASAARERERCISAVAASRRIYTTATGTERQRELEEARVTMVAYLKLKADEEDWHGVQDAGSDLRDIDAELLGLARQ